MKKSKRIVRIISCIAMLLLLAALAACGTNDVADDAAPDVDPPVDAEDDDPVDPHDELVLAAQEEGEVVVYISIPEDAANDLAQAFQDRYGIRVVHQRVVTGDQTIRVGEEFDAGQVRFDVSQTADEVWTAEMAEAGHFMALDPSELPALNAYPEDLLRDEYVIIGLSPIVVIYNTSLISEDDAPATIQDFLDPRWDANFSLVHPDVSLAYRLAYYAWLEELGESEFEEYMDELLAKNPNVERSGSSAAQQVAAGEMAWTFSAASFFPALEAEGAPVAMLYPEPTAAGTRVAAVATEAANPNAAKLFVNFMATPEGLEIMNGGGAAAAPYPGAAETALEMPDHVRVLDPGEVETEVEGRFDLFMEVFERAGY